MRVIYIISIEDVIRSPLIKSQVTEVLKKISENKEVKSKISLLSIYPVFNYLRFRKELIELQKELNKYKISFKAIPIFMLTRFFYMNLFFLLIYILQLLPILFWIEFSFSPAILHCRSYPAALIGLFMKMLFNKHFLFDMRGLYPEEGIIHNRFKRSSLSFKIWKFLERKLIERADLTIVVSNPFYEIIVKDIPKGNIKIIPTCAKSPDFCELEKWNKQIRDELSLTNQTVVCYEGAIQSWYDPMFILSVLRRIEYLMPEIEWYFLFLIVGNKSLIEEKIENDRILKTVPYKVLLSDPSEIQRYLATADFGILPASKLPTSITFMTVKFAEYLTCGVPVLCSKNAGGAAEIVKKFKVGLIYDELTDDELRREVKYFIEQRGKIKKQIWGIGKELFSLERCAKKYLGLYTYYGDKNF